MASTAIYPSRAPAGPAALGSATPSTASGNSNGPSSSKSGQTDSQILCEIENRPIPIGSFAFADFLKHEYHFGIDPSRPVCQLFMQGHCPLMNDCPDRHPIKATYQNLVCKHWLRGLCKKGDQCDFLHEYNLRKMPECSHFSRNQVCMTGDACLYPHLDPAFRRPSCPHYERGFCPLGQLCANKHLRRPPPCPFYLAGFCPDGPRCAIGSHPRFTREIPPPVTKAGLAKSLVLLEQQRLAKAAEQAAALVQQSQVPSQAQPQQIPSQY